ncbi:hypothetical protein [Virgibacillus sp. YIM 98842]|uniref:hypothetical protein n=1 Tax=Virgibacillus sp. YIM 98842 TaxID=2663533 RepID=UPI0013DB75AE|nr:hypothetical protein [Virgibacillus sp. YIM 98842]
MMEMSAGLFFYAGFLFLTLLTAIVSNFKNKLIPFAYITIIVSLAVPLINLIFIGGKPANISGVSYLLQEFLNRNLWAVLIGLMYIYLTAWAVLFIYTLHGENFKKWYGFMLEKGKELWMTILGKIKESGRQKEQKTEK